MCSSVAVAVKGRIGRLPDAPRQPRCARVMTGEDGVLAPAEPGSLVVDFSTIRPDVARELAQRAQVPGLRMLDAPVSGGEAGAGDATLSVMVGGAADDVEAAGEVLRTVGRTVVHVGPSGLGQTVKAANQLMVAGHLQVLAEAVVPLEASGVELGPALDVIGGGLADPRVFDQKREGTTQRNFAPPLPHRSAPRGPRHRDRRRPRGVRRHAGGGPPGAADGVRGRVQGRGPRPLGAPARRPAAQRPS